MPSKPSPAHLFALTSLWAPALLAQNFAEADRSALPRVPAEAVDFWVTDLDLDGHEDLVVRSLGALATGPNPIAMRGLGAGSWELSLSQILRVAVGVADVDNDGDPDVVYESGIAVNDGSGNLTFTPIWNGLNELATIADFTGDGLVDVILSSSWSGSSRFLVNQGGLAFVDETAARWPVLGFQLTQIALDADGDGDQDVFAASFYGGGERLLLNQNGVMTDAPAGSLPGFLQRTTCAAAGDLDGDGDLDLVLGGMDVPPRLYLNLGNGTFVDASSNLNVPSNESVWSVAIGDVDGDGDADVLLGRQASGLLLRNQGGSFTPDPVAFDARGHCTTALRLHDLDGDGDPDLLQGASEHAFQNPPFLRASDLAGFEMKVLWNDGTGAFVDTTRRDLPTHDDADAFAAIGDVTNNGFPDIVVASATGRVMANDGYGNFPSLPQSFPAAGRPLLGDLDGDGDRDCVVVASDGRFWALQNPGNGSFQAWTGPLQIPVPANFHCSDAALADIDGDGLLDLVASTAHDDPGFGPPPYGAPESLWLGQGNGGFSVANGWFTTDTGIHDFDVGDLDGDGDLDLAANGGLYFQNGGSFAFATFQGNLNWGRGCIALADLDGDGDLDAALGNKCLGFGCWPGNDEPANEVWYNDGTGAFSTGTTLGMTNQTGTWSVATGDTDLDGDVDIVFGNGASRIYRDQLVENLGQGQWNYPPAPWDHEAEDTRQVLLADLDLDGDLDLFALNLPRGGMSDRSKLLWNLTRQLVVPGPARVGRPYRIEMHGATAGAGLWISLQPGFSALPPYGTLALGSLGLSPLATLAPPTSGTTATLTLPIPNVPSLAGTTVYLQGIDVASQLLSNGVSESFVAW